MKIFPDIAVAKPDILLPRPGIEMQKWSVIACDQYTSEPEYWESAKSIIGDAPSTLNLILPEVYLGKGNEASLIENTQRNMLDYLQNGYLVEREGFILVERKVAGKTRHGIMMALDLEAYDFSQGSQSLIRATEGTVLDRLPPRMKIREGASLELPHILVLIDDPENSVIGPIITAKSSLETLYDFELMKGSGHLKGYGIPDGELEHQMIKTIQALAEPHQFYQKYGVSDTYGILLFAMGDGNHSLATAKAIWEKNKSKVGMNHPSRYALIELENVHDSGLEFEPIHRVLFACNESFESMMGNYYGASFHYHPYDTYQQVKDAVYAQTLAGHAIGVVNAKGFGVIQITKPQANLPVGTLQPCLDEWKKNGGVKEIDYVHGDDVVLRLGQQAGNLGLLLPPMPKSDLFKTVILDGALPRKTFSMGEAYEKRFYLECRKIK